MCKQKLSASLLLQFFFRPFQDSRTGIEGLPADVNAGQSVHPCQILNDIMVVIGFADLRNTEEDDKLRFGH